MGVKTGKFEPQTVGVVAKKADGWALIDTFAGKYWVYLDGNARYIEKTVKVYGGKEDSSPEGLLEPQIVKIIEQEGDWLKIETSNGEKWVNPTLNLYPEGVTVIGDSVCLGAKKALPERIENCAVDAAGSRQMWQARNLLSELENARELREYIVIALGTNQNKNTFEQIEQILKDLRPGHRVIFVTPYNGKLDESSVTNKIAAYIRTLPEQYPFVTVADWASVIAPQKNLIGGDYVHIGGNKVCVKIYVDCVIDALAEAKTKPSKSPF